MAEVTQKKYVEDLLKAREIEEQEDRLRERRGIRGAYVYRNNR